MIGNAAPSAGARMAASSFAANDGASGGDAAFSQALFDAALGGPAIVNPIDIGGGPPAAALGTWAASSPQFSA